MEKKYLDVAFECKDVAKNGVFEGYASIYGNIDQGGDVVVEGAFDKSLEEFAARGEFPLIAWQHKTTEPIADPISVVSDSVGLAVKASLWLDEERGKVANAVKAYRLLKSKNPKGMSIGYIPMTVEDKLIDGKTVRFILEAKLFECSIVTFPMNQEARITSVKNLSCDGLDKRQLEKSMRDAGLSQKMAKTAVSVVFKTADEGGSDDGLSDCFDQLRNNLSQFT